jgi:hypothetical protein
MSHNPAAIAKPREFLALQMKELERRRMLLSAFGMDDNAMAFDEQTGQFHTVPESLKSFFQSAYEPATQEAIAEEIATFTAAYGDSTGQKMRTLQGFRIVTINNLLRVIPKYREAFFEKVTLQDDEIPRIHHETQGEVDVAYFTEGSKGGPDKVKAVRQAKGIEVPLYLRRTDAVEYQLKDLRTGDVADSAKKTFDLARDAAAKDDNDHYTVLAASFGSFTTTGSKPARTYVFDRYIQSGSVPTTNELTTPGQSGSTLLKLATLKEAVKYCKMFGTLIDGTEMRPTGLVYCPAANCTDLADEITATGSQCNPVADGILRDFSAFFYAGVNWVIMPCHDLPAKKVIIPTNKKPGISYEKPSWNKEFLMPSDPQERIMQNKESRSYGWSRGIAIPEARSMGAIRVAFQS